MKALIAYFSRKGNNWVDGGVKSIPVGNTEVIANYIKEAIPDATLLKLEMKTPYSEDYITCTEEAKKDQEENHRPEILSLPESIDEYDVVFLGYPCYWSDMPMVMYTFLEHYDFKGKKLYAFSTHEGSGMGASRTNIERTTGGKILSVMPIPGSLCERARNKTLNWVESLGL